MTSLVVLFSLIAAISPFFLWPIEQLLPYPAIIEEVFKWILLLFFLKYVRIISLQQLTRVAGLFGFIFGISESVLYFFNFFILGNFNELSDRIYLTLLMHIITFVTIAVFLQSKDTQQIKLKPKMMVGLLIAIIIHWGFNFWVGTL